MAQGVSVGDIDQLVLRIEEGTDAEEDEIRERIREKEKEFSGLVSPEGAAHIVAKELGVNLLEDVSGSVQIESVAPGMDSVNLKAKVADIGEVRTFDRDGEEGRVANVTLADDSGSIRMSLWDEQVEMIEDKKLEEGMTIDIVNGYTREDNRGNPELRVGKRGMIKKSEEEMDIDLGALRSEGAARKEIEGIGIGESVELRGALVQIYDNNLFFTVCPECEESLNEGKCGEHGSVVPEPVMLLSGVLDDGTGNVRVVFFRDDAERVLGMETEEAWEKTEDGEKIEAVRDEMDGALGRELVVRGYIKENDFFERPEMIVQNVPDFDAEEEAKRIAKELKVSEASDS